MQSQRKVVRQIPNTTHADTNMFCNFEKYNRRMWCWAEVFSFYCRRGFEDMYIAVKENASYQLINVDEHQVDDTLLVFEGD